MAELIQELITAREGGFPPASLGQSPSCAMAALPCLLGLAASGSNSRPRAGLAWRKSLSPRVAVRGKATAHDWVSHWTVSVQDPARSRASLLPTGLVVRSAHTISHNSKANISTWHLFSCFLLWVSHSLSTLQSVNYCWWNASNTLLSKCCRCAPPLHIACSYTDSHTSVSLFHQEKSARTSFVDLLSIPAGLLHFCCGTHRKRHSTF